METRIKIRGYHTDLYQHVNNARYLEFLEEGRWQILEEYLNIENFLQQDMMFFVVNINISYKSQARVNDTVIVKSGLNKIGKTSAVIRQQVLNTATGKICIEADITFVITDKNQKPRKFEGELRELIEKIPRF